MLYTQGGCLPTSEYCVTDPLFGGFVKEQGLLGHYCLLFVFILCVSGDWIYQPVVGGGSFSKFLRFLQGAPLCGDTSFN